MDNDRYKIVYPYINQGNYMGILVDTRPFSDFDINRKSNVEIGLEYAKRKYARTLSEY